MLTLVITALVVIGMIYVLSITKLKTYDIMFLILGVIFIGIVISTSPVYGYHEKVLEQEIQLVELSDDVYVTHYANDVYLYKYKVESNSDDEGSCETNIVRENVIETESQKCTNPVLRKYVKKAKTGIFSFCWQQEVEYEFYVPEGTIDYSKEVLN